MSLVDHHDIFVGSTDDGWTFLVLNRPFNGAARILTAAGFTARQHQGRTLYILPPETATDAHERAGVAAYGLMAHTMDFVDLAWTTRHSSTGDAEPEAAIRFRNGTVTATALTDRAAAVLARHGFTPADTPQAYTLPTGLGEAATVNTVVRAETHLHADGVQVRVDLGIPTLHDIPSAPPRPPAAPAPPSPDQAPRRQR
ncbi:hypothetical protein [Streptomyces hokutonensis]|uniref:hypothetical protein n=1 Tax=Streptomyces hokutonensis TaxID=1306990 RepID=UPI0037F3CE2A